MLCLLEMLCLLRVLCLLAIPCLLEVLCLFAMLCLLGMLCLHQGALLTWGASAQQKNRTNDKTNKNICHNSLAAQIDERCSRCRTVVVAQAAQLNLRFVSYNLKICWSHSRSVWASFSFSSVRVHFLFPSRTPFLTIHRKLIHVEGRRSRKRPARLSF